MSTVEPPPIADWQQPLPDADLYRARSVDEALALAGAHPAARFIAGGTTLVRMGRFGATTPPTLIAIGDIDELRQIREQDGRILIGSLAVHGALCKSPLVAGRAGLLPLAAQEIAGPAVRNLATVGGNVFIGWDLVPALLALDAQVLVRDHGGEHTIALHRLYNDDGTPRLRPDQLITAISVAADLPGYAYQKIARRRATSRAIVGVGVSMASEGGRCRDLRIGVGGAGLTPLRLWAAEELLRGQELSAPLLAQAGELAFAAAAHARDDIEARAWYTREMARVLVERALRQAAGRAPAAPQ